MRRRLAFSRTDMNQTPIIVDTRERMPYVFDSQFVQVTRSALPAGDYSLVGYERRVAVERKSLGDFVQSVIHNRARFEREIIKLREYDAACVLIEAELGDVVAHRYRGYAHPNAVIGSAIALFVDHGVPFIFGSTREIAGRFTAGFLQRYYKRMIQTRPDGKEVTHE